METPDATRVTLTAAASIRAGGQFLIAAALSLAALALLPNSASAQADLATADVAVECYDLNGRTDGLLVVDLASSSTGDRFDIAIGTAGLTRSVGLGADLTFTVRVSGRPDGPLPVVVTAGDNEIYNQVIPVDCDPFVGPEVEITSGCIGQTGRIDLTVENPGPANADYTLRVDSLSKTVNVFAGDIERISITGRPDADYAVVAEREGTVLLAETITSRCEPTTASVISTCLGDNGVVYLYVPGPDPDLRYAVGTVGRRAYTQTATSNRGAVSGRPDGTHNVTLFSASGSVAGRATVTIDCDPGPCDSGYNEVAGECVTPGPLACVAPQIVLESIAGVEGFPPSYSCVDEPDCPWQRAAIVSGPLGDGALRSGLTRCTVALP